MSLEIFRGMKRLILITKYYQDTIWLTNLSTGKCYAKNSFIVDILRYRIVKRALVSFRCTQPSFAHLSTVVISIEAEQTILIYFLSVTAWVDRAGGIGGEEAGQHLPPHYFYFNLKVALMVRTNAIKLSVSRILKHMDLSDTIFVH